MVTLVDKLRMPLWCLAMLCCFGACNPDREVIQKNSEHVLKPGCERAVQDLFHPHKSGTELQDGTFVGIQIKRDRILAKTQSKDGIDQILEIVHPNQASPEHQQRRQIAYRVLQDDRVSPPTTVTLTLQKALDQNDPATFPWSQRALFRDQKAQDITLGSWLKGTGLPLINWILLGAFLGSLLVARWRARTDAVVDREIWLGVAAIVLAGVALRLGLAPRALYKEAFHFRNLNATTVPVFQGMDVGGYYPLGSHSLIQSLHRVTGAHPVDLLFSLHLLLGCCIPIVAASIGARIHRYKKAALIYAAVAAFAPHAIKYSHSEALTGPLAFFLLLAIRGALDAGIVQRWTWICICSTAMVAHFRPEGFVVWPGICLIVASRARWSRGGRTHPILGRWSLDKVPTRIPRGLAVLRELSVFLIPILLLSGTAVWTSMHAQATGDAVSSSDLSVVGATSSTSPFLVLWGMIKRAFDPSWNVFLNPSLTPPWLTASAFLGWFLLIRKDRWTGLGVIIIGVALMGVYTLMDSTLIATGEMRYHLSALPVVLIGSGAGLSFVCEQLEQRQRRSWPVAWSCVVFMGVSLAVYLPLIQYEQHPFQQEFLAAQNLRSQLTARPAIVLVPDRDRSIIDIYPETVAPAFLDPAMKSRTLPFSRHKDALAAARRGEPVFVYRGLYSFYASGPQTEEAWFWEKMAQIGLRKSPNASPKIVTVQEETRPFHPNHTVLDRDRLEDSFTVGLYRVVFPD